MIIKMHMRFIVKASLGVMIISIIIFIIGFINRDEMYLEFSLFVMYLAIFLMYLAASPGSSSAGFPPWD